jgi:hypothetical protein
MTLEEEALAFRATRSCQIVPLSSGDLAVFDANGDLFTICDIRPMSFGGFGLGGLCNAIELAVNKTATERFKIPVKGAQRPGQYWETHTRAQTTGQHKYQAPTPVAIPAKVVTSAAQLGLRKVVK